MIRRSRRRGGWSSDYQPAAQTTAVDRLRAQITATLAPARAVISQRRRSVSERLLDLGDLAVAATATPAGRVLTSAGCLTGAWALIGSV